ncbi:MAG TPA: nucleoside triphosphate pyrophosphatase [Steroidobacteraceae bacterium]|nr:nucleoside triphosphate pyrophosphatase [Steroidobacteraceae bacterium]
MQSSPNPLIYLASASPRRSSLLTQIGVAHHVKPVDIDESHRAGEAPADYVVRLARTKAETLWQRLAEHERLPVLGSDTTVALGAEILGKPASREEGIAMLRRLSGETHQVHTGVALRSPEGLATRLSTSEVTFRVLSVGEAESYWETGEPADKAGGYAIQGRAAAFIERIGGSYSGIVGLPLFETAELLGSLGWTSFETPTVSRFAEHARGAAR